MILHCHIITRTCFFQAVALMSVVCQLRIAGPEDESMALIGREILFRFDWCSFGGEISRVAGRPFVLEISAFSAVKSCVTFIANRLVSR